MDNLGSVGRAAIGAAVLFVAVTGATSAVAQQEPTLSGSHLYVVPTTAEGEDAIEAAAADVVASYESFKLVSADGSSNDALLVAGGERRDDMRTVATAAGNEDPAAERAFARTDESLALVQFKGPIKDAWLEELRATGVTVVTYMAQNAYLVHASPTAVKALADFAETPEVRAITAFGAGDKIEPGIASTGSVEVAVETLDGAPGAEAREVLSGADELRGPARFAGTTAQFVTIDVAAAQALAQDPGVVAIEPWVDPELLDERAASIVAGRVNAAGDTLSAANYFGFLTSQGFPTTTLPDVIDITDEGIDKGIVPVPAGSHNDFFVNGNPAANSRLTYAQEATAGDTNARDCGGHGTNVASIAAGYNKSTGASVEDAAGFNYGLGVAPRTKLGATKIFNCAGTFDVTTSLAALHSAAFASGARLSNNSWGAPVGGAYNAQAREFDFLVRDARAGQAGNQQFVELVAAGNSGSGANTIGSPATAKNVITVGASENVRPIGATDGCGVTDAGANNARDIINFSSRGPTDDGRIKPDIVAPGTHVTGAQPQTGAEYDGSGTCNPQFPAGSAIYSLVSGTSQATPEVTGAAALIRDWYRREVGGGTAVPSPAMTKALLVNTATDQVGGQDGASGTNANIPTQVQGWGRVNLGNTFGNTARDFVDQTNTIRTTGHSERKTYTVASSAKPLRVSLAWTDAPGPTSGNAFVNDLDLIVSADGQTFRGNVFSSGLSATGGAPDTRNNLENVFLPAGITGPVSVDVRATNIAGDGVPGNADVTDQDYALVVSNANVAAPAPVLVHDHTTVTEVGDGDSDIEPGESFRLRERLRNTGTLPATGINATLTGPPRTTVPVANSGYPNIPKDGLGTNATQFRVKLANNYVCGEPVDLTLSLTTAQGPQTVAVEVPTGAGSGGPATNHQSTDVPKAIPDDSVTGVTSTLAISGAGTISDLNVRVGAITHTYVGDLEISLRGPDATTVTLIDNGGGSGDNFTDTVFDDEAATPIASGLAPFTGSWRPHQPLSAFDGKPANGTWTLKVIDSAAADTGTLSAWGLTRRAPC